MHRASAVGSIIGAIALIALPVMGCSLILSFDEPPGPPDAALADAIPSAACDFGEANEDRPTAFPLDPVTAQSAGICTDGDHDYYSLTVVAGQVLDFEILFEQDGANGDLDMYLYDSNGAIVGRSLTTNSDERLICPGSAPACPQLAAGNYFIEVFGFANVHVNGYTINYSLTGP